LESGKKNQMSNYQSKIIKWTAVHGTTDNRYECVSKKDRVGTGQYFEWIQGFTT
jgi:Fe-S cluster assembly scaffold protein SufB